MIIGFIFAVVTMLITQNWWLSMIVLHLVSGLRKALIWSKLPITYQPGTILNNGVHGIIVSALFWPVIVIAHKGDPYYSWVKSERG